MGTIWDKIYDDYVKGKVYLSLNDIDVVPAFRNFVETSAFSVKAALDIGCGLGRYLKYLEDLGFTVSGIDSSSTAIALTETILSSKANAVVANMFDYEIPKNKYDLIFSISAIHHGRKEEVNNLINRIISAILPNGKIFITLPVYTGKGLKYNPFRKADNLTNQISPAWLQNRKILKALGAYMDKRGENQYEWEVIGDGVMMMTSGVERGLPHSFYKKQEVDKLFSPCREYTLERKSEEWIIKATPCGSIK